MTDQHLQQLRETCLTAIAEVLKPTTEKPYPGQKMKRANIAVADIMQLITSTIEAEVVGARIDELEYLKENGKWFTERGYYCFDCNTLTHFDSYRNTSGRLGIPYICSNCGVGTVTHSSHVSLEQIKRRIAALQVTQQENKQ